MISFYGSLRDLFGREGRKVLNIPLPATAQNEELAIYVVHNFNNAGTFTASTLFGYNTTVYLGIGNGGSVSYVPLEEGSLIPLGRISNASLMLRMADFNFYLPNLLSNQWNGFIHILIDTQEHLSQFLHESSVGGQTFQEITFNNNGFNFVETYDANIGGVWNGNLKYRIFRIEQVSYAFKCKMSDWIAIENTATTNDIARFCFGTIDLSTGLGGVYVPYIEMPLIVEPIIPLAYTTARPTTEDGVARGIIQPRPTIKHIREHVPESGLALPISLMYGWLEPLTAGALTMGMRRTMIVGRYWDYGFDYQAN